MAVEFSVENSRGSEYNFYPEDIVIKPELNGRHDLPDVEWIISGFINPKIGQLQPVLIRSENKQPVLVAGFSRWRAAIEINKCTLTPVRFKLRCVYFKGNELDGFLANIAENNQRNATTPMDNAYNMLKLERWGQTIGQIAEVYHQKPAWVTRHLKLVNLEPEAQAAVAKGRLKPTAAMHIAELSAAQQRKAVEGNGTVKIAPGKLGLKSIREIVQAAADDTTQPRAVRKFCEELLKEIKGDRHTQKINATN